MGLKEVGGLTFVLQLCNFIHPASNVQMKKNLVSSQSASTAYKIRSVSFKATSHP